MRSFRYFFIMIFWLFLVVSANAKTLSEQEWLEASDELFLSHGFNWFNQFPHRKLAGFDVNQIYYNLETREFIILRKLDLEKDRRNDFRVYNFKASNSEWQISFHGMDRSQMQMWLKKIASLEANKFSLIKILLPQARANTAQASCHNSNLNWFQYAKVIGSAAGQTVMNCLSHGFSGAKNHFEGKIESVQNVGLSFSFDFVAKAFSGIMDFATNFQSHISKVIAGAGAAADWLANTSFEDKLTIICNLIGELGADFLTKLFAAGPAGVAALMLKIGEKLSQFNFIKKLLDLKKLIEEKGSAFLGTAKEELEQMIKGVLTGRVSEKQVDEFDKKMRASCKFAT